MIRLTFKRAAVLAALTLAGCQTEAARMSGGPIVQTAGPASPMDGSWAATDGVFVASFEGGKFTSRFTKTNEILAQGAYRVNGREVTMEWISVQAQQQRSANCTITGSNSVRCEQSGGGGFDLRRTA